MKLIIIIMTAFLMQVKATGFAQRVTFVKKNASLEQVFDQINKQTGYSVVWSSKVVDPSTKINADFRNSSLASVLQSCISASGLTYSIEDKSIVIKKSTIAEVVKEGIINFLRQDSVNYHGTVTDDKGQPLPGATIRVKGGTRTARSTAEGAFVIYAPAKATLIISYLGYATREINLTANDANRRLKINMTAATSELGEVAIVSTGYQDLPKDRATGSFEVITAKQLQHSTDPNLLKRLEGITTSMDFRNTLRPVNSSRKQQQGASIISQLTIRGQNTLTSSVNSTSGWPLVVIDGIASAYSIDMINPDDVESINILKDAAAASIWGSRAANGVIVIKTKKGAFETPARVSFNSNLNVTEKLDLFYKKQMSVSDYIDAQKFEYAQLGFDPNKPEEFIQDPNLVQPQVMISPVWEILNQQQRGAITPAQANAQLDALRGNDIRKDFTKYFLRNAVMQSYSLAVDGGSKKIASRLSSSYNNSIDNTRGSGSNRFTLGYNASVKPLKNLTLTANTTYFRDNSEGLAGSAIIQGSNLLPPFYPYARLADDQGNHLVVPITYRPAFLDSLSRKYGNKILDMRWTPLDEMGKSYIKKKSQGLNLNMTAAYQLSPVFSFNVTYNYNRAWSASSELRDENSYFMRNLINTYTNPVTLERAVPLGGWYLPRADESTNHTGRASLSINKTWNDKHAISAVAGADITDSYSLSKNSFYLGYNKNTLRYNNQLDFANRKDFLFNDENGSSSDRIPFSDGKRLTDNKTRTLSVYSNVAYTYNNRYTVSGSIRKDGSNEFGLGTNKTGTPYYSAGLGWNINGEEFYKLSWLPVLKLRANYGYNGNVNATALPRAYISSVQTATTLLPYAGITGIDNRELRPERTGMLNLGLDFGTKDNRLSGSIEYYDKRTKDLLTNNAVDPSVGFNRVVFNTGNLHGYGVDFTLNSRNLQRGIFSWESNFLFSYNRVKISKLFTPGAKTVANAINELTAKNEGYELNRLFAYRWGGLDPQTGDPIGFLNGQKIVVKADDYAPINAISAAPMSELRYFGSSVPVYYGSLRNTFNISSFTISFNILYKLGYYARRPQSDMVNYGTLFNGDGSINISQGAEYSRRWQKPGDEQFTNVPSLFYAPYSDPRSNFYQFSEINVIKADHVRLQEINLSYVFKRSNNWFIKNPRVYANVNNLGILWRANKLGLDPDINDYPQPRTYSFGLSANF